jgi:hypothetical protein
MVQWQSTILVFLMEYLKIHRHGVEHFKVRLRSRRGKMGGRHHQVLTAALRSSHDQQQLL